MAEPIILESGESILFMMEGAIKHQKGIWLQRIHDNFWFWDSG
jgi:hypothetical protein